MIKSDENIQIIRCDDESYILIENSVNIDDGNRIKNQIIATISKENEKEALAELLMQIAEWLGYDYDKFGKENLNISFDKKGSKVCDDLDDVHDDPTVFGTPNDGMQSVSEFVDEKMCD
jgi:hypothetical protein